jgi:hypothetical protein
MNPISGTHLWNSHVVFVSSFIIITKHNWAMKRSISNLQTIVLASVLSVALLFGVVLSMYAYHTQIADAKKSHQHNSGTSISSGSKDATPDNTPDTTTQQHKHSNSNHQSQILPNFFEYQEVNRNDRK